MGSRILRTFSGAVLGLGVFAAGLFNMSPAHAEDNSGVAYISSPQMARSIARLEVEEDYALGINRFQVDGHTEIIGWRLSQALYFGRQDGLDSGLTLVWQQESNQLSLSKDGLRLTRRF